MARLDGSPNHEESLYARAKRRSTSERPKVEQDEELSERQSYREIVDDYRDDFGADIDGIVF